MLKPKTKQYLILGQISTNFFKCSYNEMWFWKKIEMELEKYREPAGDNGYYSFFCSETEPQIFEALEGFAI